MRPVQCAPRGSSYAISHESQSCVLRSAGSSGSVACCVLGRLCRARCVVMSTEVTQLRCTERGFRYGTGRSSRATKRFGVQPVYLACTICTCDALPPR